MRIVLIQRLTGFHHLDQVRRGDDLHRLAWCESETPLERALVILGDSIVHFESKIPYSMPVPCIDHLGRLSQGPRLLPAQGRHVGHPNYWQTART